MRKLLRAMIEWWRERQRVRSRQVLDELKLRYHTFRILLAHNDVSLDLLRSIDLSLRSAILSWDDLSEETEELLDVTYEMVDGLNRLSGGHHGALYERHRQIGAAIRKTLTGMALQSLGAPRCIPLKDLTGETRGLVGGKACTLGFLKGAGFPVPDGFAVTREACAEILAENGTDRLIERRLQRWEGGAVQGVDLEDEAAEIRNRILEVDLPAGLANDLRHAYENLSSGGVGAISVRSSALVEDRPEHTFAGQFKTVLNVTTFDALKLALKEVIASNYSARAIAYRVHAGLSPSSHDMAVLCQHMIPARVAGGIFTVDPVAPDSGRVLMNAVPGLGMLAVDGSAPTDLYRPLREFPEREAMSEWAHIAVKTHRAVPVAGGGVAKEDVPAAERGIALLSREQVLSLVRYGRMIENLIGQPQDIEWALSPDNELFILQSRDIRLAARDRHIVSEVRGRTLLKKGIVASPGRCVGRVKIIRSFQDVAEWRNSEGPPGIMVLHQSLVDAAAWLPEFEGVVVDLGNPADHLSCVAREYARPMLTGAGRATEVLRDGEWVVLDADSAMVLQAPENVWAEAEEVRRQVRPAQSGAPAPAGVASPEAVRLLQLIEPLHLTDAYGPTFSIHECRSIHDVIRYTHEMAVIAMFQVGDGVVEEAWGLTHRLDEGMPFHFIIIDLGGGLVSGMNGYKIHLGDVQSVPLLALWRGISTPGLRWGEPPPGLSISGLLSRSMMDNRSARPVGNPNYALITRDYLNLNARVDYHFTMVDAVCGANPRENYIRFRFKGGGTTALQRERRARFVGTVLGEHHFFTDQQGDLVNGTMTDAESREIEERLVMIGRLLGFSRLLDATMCDDTVPTKVARAFLDGDYGLQGLKADIAGSCPW